MTIANCLSPVTIRNPYTGAIVSVPCGKCEACRNSKASIWVQRLQQESLCWPYVIFVTLTYDDDHLRTLHKTNYNEYTDLNDGYCIDFTGLMDNKSLKFVTKRGCVPYLSKRDCQLFIKLLRYHATELIKKQAPSESPQIRYFICGEYGETTLRPHYHALLFVSSKSIYENMQSLLCKSWQHGFTSWSRARDAAAYCAKYVNCLVNVPKIYEHAQIKPFALCSKSPFIGSLSIPTEEVQKIWSNGLVERTIYDPKSKEYKSVSIWRTLQDKLFPKCRGFSQVAHNDRITIYGYARFAAADTFDEFKAFVSDQVDTIERCYGQMRLTYSPQHYIVGGQLVDAMGLPVDMPDNPNLRVVPVDTLKLTFTQWLISIWYANNQSKDDSILRRWWYTSRRVLTQSLVFGCSLSTYVDKIEQYYNNKDMHNLRQQLLYEQDFAKDNPVQFLIHLFPLFNQRTNYVNDPSDFVYSLDALMLASFGLDPVRYCHDAVYRNKYSLDNCNDYKKFRDLALKIHRDSVKTKRKNDYLLAHPDKAFF